MADHNREEREDDGRIRIWVNSGANMSRGKYAAAAVHAALTAAGVHPGVPVIVLGGQRDHIEKMCTVIHDAGRTEVEPGTATAGTDYVFEQAHTPTSDERGTPKRAGDLHDGPPIKEVTAMFDGWEGAPTWAKDPHYRDSAIRWHARGVKDGWNAHRTVQGEPTGRC